MILMTLRGTAFGGWLLASWLPAVVVAGGAAPVLAEMVEIPDEAGHAPATCDGPNDGKDGVCGHALGVQAFFEATGSLPSLAVTADAESDETDVTHCHLDIEVNPTAETVTGSNTLEVTSLVGGLSQISLDLRSNMTVDGAAVNGQAATYDRPTNQVRITLDRAYGTGETFQVAVAYHGTPSNLNWGSFDFGEHAGTPVAASLSEPWYANTWWPCKEAIHDKFTMDTWVTVPDWMIVASNGTLQGTDTLSGSRKRFRWRESYPISVYLVSVAMTNYTKWTDYYVHPGGSMPVEFYIYPEEVATVQPLVADVVTMVQAFSGGGVYGEYPFINEKYGIAQFEWCCGMEHQTITSQGSFPETRNAHELAHSWWGNDVTCKTWHDIWLNEGFASFSEAVWFEKQPGGTYQAYLDRMLVRKPSYFADTVYCYDISSVSRIFSQNYSYNKGAWVMHMLRFVLGDADFFGGLQSYRAAYTGLAADTEEFEAAMEAAVGEPLDWFFDQWVFGGGGPYYRFGWQNVQIDGATWVRCYVNQYQRESRPDYPYFRMPVDITITTAAGSATHTVWNRAEQQWYLLPAEGAATQVVFDKDVHILRANDQNVAYVNGPPKIVRTVPAPGERVNPPAAVPAVDLYFSEAVAYGPSDFSVTGSLSGPQSFTPGYDAGSYRVRLELAQPLAEGETYTVHVADTLQSSEAGSALDGEMGAMLPSGDGLPGGGADFAFTVGEALPPCNDPAADIDGDADVDQSDFGTLQACMTGPDDPAGAYDFVLCHCFDRDGDQDVDAADLAVFTACASGPAVPAESACGDSPVLLTEGFDGPDAAGRWAVLASSADYTAQFGFDYAALGIPPAPGGNGSTTGLRLTVNNNDQVGEPAAVSAYPLGYSFAGDYALAFDMWMSFPGASAASGTTEMMNVGLNLPGASVAWPGNPGDGVTVAVTGDGDGAPGTSADYHYYRGATLLLPASGAYAAGTASTAQDNTHAYYQSLFPSPPFVVAGAPAGQWVRVEVGQSGGTITWKMNGTTIASYPEATYTRGNVMLGYMDLWSSIANPPAEAFIIYDNVEVTVP